MLYAEVLTSGDPDAVYEFFWLMFKGSVTNFTAVLNEDRAKVLFELEREIPVVSNRLNILKKEHKYSIIIEEIEAFLVKFAWSALLMIDDENFSYHINIVNTNINRWMNLPGIIKENETFALLHVLLGLTKTKSQYDLLKYVRGSEPEEFNVKKIVSRMTKFSLLKDRPTALTRLTSHVTLQPIVVEILKNIGLTDTPASIRDGQKIMNIYRAACEDDS
jgi:hypothetical protein